MLINIFSLVKIIDFNSSDWKNGRATWYGGPQGAGPDGMSIYTGSCGYGKDLGNHFVTAVPASVVDDLVEL